MDATRRHGQGKGGDVAEGEVGGEGDEVDELGGGDMIKCEEYEVRGNDSDKRGQGNEVKSRSQSDENEKTAKSRANHRRKRKDSQIARESKSQDFRLNNTTFLNTF